MPASEDARGGGGNNLTPYAAMDFMDLDRSYKQLVRRECMITFKDYMVASDAEIAEELAWASTLPGVLMRFGMHKKQSRQSPLYGRDSCEYGDAPGSHLACLTVAEREVLAKAEARLSPGEVCDLCQNPDSGRFIHSRSGPGEQYKARSTNATNKPINYVH